MVIWINFLHHVRDPRTVLDSGFHAVNSRFQVLDPDCLSVEPGFKIATVGGFPDYWSCIQDVKVQNPDSTSKKIPDSGFYN